MTLSVETEEKRGLELQFEKAFANFQKEWYQEFVIYDGKIYFVETAEKVGLGHSFRVGLERTEPPKEYTKKLEQLPSQFGGHTVSPFFITN
jgi:predicted metal-dependent TIM-barrel fold hydrolase